MHVADPRRLRSTDGAATPDLVAPGRLEARRRCDQRPDRAEQAALNTTTEGRARWSNRAAVIELGMDPDWVTTRSTLAGLRAAARTSWSLGVGREERGRALLGHVEHTPVEPRRARDVGQAVPEAGVEHVPEPVEGV